MLDALELSKYVVGKCIKDDKLITNLQLQKILYYIQKLNITKGNEELIFSDDIEAWKFGPVIPKVYYHFSDYGSMPILYFENIDTDQLDSVDPSIKEKIDKLIEEKRELQPWDLVRETHKKGGAWDRVYSPRSNNIITKESIMKYEK